MRLIYAILMIVGFALLLWSIDKSMPVYADSMLGSTMNLKVPSINPISVPYLCPDEPNYPQDGSIMVYDGKADCFRYVLPEDPLKECEEELASCEAQLDSCRPE